MIEYTEEIDAGTATSGQAAGRAAAGRARRGSVEVHRGVAPWENVLRVGDDIAKGEPIFPRGRRLRPRDLGALTGIGITRIRVFRQPRVALLATGDEIVAPERTPRPGQVRNINEYSLIAMAGAAGA